MHPEPHIHELKAAQQGDREAMHRLLFPWNDIVFGFMLNLLRHRADAEDATQETFIRIVKGLPRYEHRGEFRAWIFQIARNQASLTAQRRQRLGSREIGVEDEALQAMSPANDGSTDLDLAERAALLRHAVENLPEGEREVVLLRIDEDLKFREIAERTKTPLNTVLGRMHNALRRLKEALQPISL